MMYLDVLVCGADGSQTLERREVPDDYLPGEMAVRETSGEDAQSGEESAPS